jgi:hypothetical protein
MTAMAVLYLDNVGQPLAALTTTVSADPPPLGQAATFQVAVPVSDPSAAGPSIPRPITVARADLSLAMVQAEFDDPLDVFQWRVVTTTGPDGKEQQRLDRLGAGQVTVTGAPSGLELLLDVPRLGDERQLGYEVRNQAGDKADGVLIFATQDTRKTVPVPLPDRGAFVVFVEGYPPVTVPPRRAKVTRGGTGTTAGLELLIEVDRLGDEQQLAYEVRHPTHPSQTGTLTFGATDTTKSVKVTVLDKSAFVVAVEGHLPVTVPAAP